MIWSRISQLASKSPDHEAVIDGKGRYSYSKLLSSAQNVAGRLVSLGCGPDVRVVLYLPNGFDFVRSFLGSVGAGSITVPLSVGHKPDEIRKYLRHSRPRVVVTDRSRAGRVREIISGLDDTQPLPSVIDLDELAELEFQPAAAVAEDPDRPALLQYSTGSTGQPKPVVRSVGQLTAEADHFQKAARIDSGDRILGVVPLFHAHGFGNAMLASLMNGATLIVMEGFNPREVLSVLHAERISIFPAVPFMFKLLAEMRYNNPLELDRLRLCLSAGAALPVEINQAFHDRYGLYIRQLYGSTEAGSVTLNTDPDIEGTLDSVGRSMNGVEVGIFDPSGGVVKAGVTGEVGIRSTAMAREYEGLAEATKEAFRFGFFFPGDLGRLDPQGRLFLTGRKTLVINVAGNKVDPAEVEEVIRRYSKVKDVVVVGVSAPYGGEAVKAIVVADPPFGPADIQEACAGRLAEFKVPQIVEIRKEIPKSPLGKVLRKHLV